MVELVHGHSLPIGTWEETFVTKFQIVVNFKDSKFQAEFKISEQGVQDGGGGGEKSPLFCHSVHPIIPYSYSHFHSPIHL